MGRRLGGRWRGGNLKGEMGRGATGRWRREGGQRGGGEEGARGGGILQMDMMECYRIELQADRMPGVTEAMAFTDSYKHM